MKLTGGFVIKLISLLFALLFCCPSQALELQPRNFDMHVPAHCQNLTTDFFQTSEFEVFTISVFGGLKKGFDFVYPITRNEAGFLFKAFKSGEALRPEFAEKLKKYPELHYAHESVLATYQTRGFSFVNEGEILEILSLHAIDLALRESQLDLFVTGSIEYFGEAPTNNRGELDVVIAQQSNCQILAYGEVKLGVKSLSKARRQIQRFSYNLNFEGFSHSLIPPQRNYLQ